MRYDWRVLIYFFAYATTIRAFLFDSHTSHDLTRCPHNLRRTSNLWSFKERCIEFVLGKKTTWDNARNVCRSRGGHLVVIPDSLTQRFLMFALQNIRYSGTALWIGLSDKDREQTWKWDTGDRLHGFSHWKFGQNGSGFEHLVEDCVFLKYKDSGLWHDAVCSIFTEEHDYICQYHMLPTTTKPTTTSTTTTTTTTTTPMPSTTKRTTTPTTTTSTHVPTTTRVTTTPTTTIMTTTTTVACQEIDCQTSCPNGYSGIFVGTDGCVACRCN